MQQQWKVTLLQGILARDFTLFQAILSLSVTLFYDILHHLQYINKRFDAVFLFSWLTLTFWNANDFKMGSFERIIFVTTGQNLKTLTSFSIFFLIDG